LTSSPIMFFIKFFSCLAVRRSCRTSAGVAS
jgi:hypothetical protein